PRSMRDAAMPNTDAFDNPPCRPAALALSRRGSHTSRRPSELPRGRSQVGATGAAKSTADLDRLAINTIRFLAADAAQAANSGHPGLPMGAAAAAYVLWTRHLKHDPTDPTWPDRDRFLLSAGHGSTLLYALLHLTGYDLPLEEIKRFRQWGSRTPG